MTKKFASPFALVLLLSRGAIAMDDERRGPEPAQRPASFVSRARSVARLATTATIALLLAGTVGAQDLSKPTRRSAPSDEPAFQCPAICPSAVTAQTIACCRAAVGSDYFDAELAHRPREVGHQSHCGPVGNRDPRLVQDWETENLLWAVKNGNVTEARRAIDDCCAKIEMEGTLDWWTRIWPLLNLATERGDVAMAALLVSRGADLENRQPLHWALNHMVLVEYDREQAMGPVAADRLKRAITRGRDEIAQLLVCAGADVEQQEDIRGKQPLHRAAEIGHVAVVKALLARGADVNALAFGRTTPLHLASEVCNGGLMRLLLEAGADVDARDGYGDTPLHEAARMGCTHEVPILLEYGADIEPVNDKGRTPFQQAHFYSKASWMRGRDCIGAANAIYAYDRYDHKR